MRPRLRPSSSRPLLLPHPVLLHSVRHASALTSHPSPASSSLPPPPYPPTQPPSFRPPQFRKSQLIRQYASLLRTTPLLLIFQHNNLKSTEWMAIRRELAIALRKVDAATTTSSPDSTVQSLADSIKIQTLQTGLFEAALRLVEFYRPPAPPSPAAAATSSAAETSAQPPTHLLSARAHKEAKSQRSPHPLAPLLSGPLAALTFPAVSPQHLAAALSILSPHAPRFAAPKRRTNPGYHEGAVQGGLQKLLLLGARVEGEVFDLEGTRWVGGIEGGLDGLRGQIVGMLQGVSAGLVGVLESPGRGVYATVEGRRLMLEKEKEEVGASS